MATKLSSVLERALRLIAELPGDSYSKLVETLKSRPFLQSDQQVEEALSGSFDGDDALNVGRFLLAFAKRTGQPGERTVEGTAEALITDQNLEMAEDELAELRRRFVELATLPSVMATAAASNAERRGLRALYEFDASTSLQIASAPGSKEHVFAQQHVLTIRHGSPFDETTETVTLAATLDELKFIAKRAGQVAQEAEDLLKTLRQQGMHIWADEGESNEPA